MKSQPAGQLRIISDAALNDSDKEMVVPAGKTWEVLAVFASLVASATVGNRRLAVEIQDPADAVLARISAGAVQVASATTGYTFAPGVADQAATVNGHLQTGIPALQLPAGCGVRVLDAAAVDAAADDMTVRLLVREF